jgi:O-antigen/teichoic acid export membrane protein
LTAGSTGGAAARRVAVNTLVPFTANLAGRALALGMAVVMARTLGPSGTGAYAFVVNLWLYASIVSDFGLGTWLTRAVARDPRGASDAVRVTLGLRLALSVIAAVGLVGVALAYDALRIGDVGTEIVATAALLGLGLVPGAISAAGTALFNAHERMVFPAAVQLGGAVATTALGAAALLSGGGIVALGWVSLAVNVVTAAVFGVACARRFVPLGVAARPAEQLALARETLPLMLNGLLNNVFFRIDIQVLQAKGSAVVGNYANAYKVIDAAGVVPSSFVLALFPQLSRRAASAEGLLRIYALAAKLLIVVALAIAFPVALLATPLTRLAWGAAFLPDSATALRILVWFLPLSFFNGLTQYVLIALGLQAKITRAFAVAAAFNVGANLVLIPVYGYVAAAWVTIATEVVLLVPFVAALRGKLDLRELAGSLGTVRSGELALLRSTLGRGAR